MSYADFLASKRRKPPTSGITVHPDVTIASFGALAQACRSVELGEADA